MKYVPDYADPPRKQNTKNTKIAFGVGMLALACPMLLGPIVFLWDVPPYSALDFVAGLSIIGSYPMAVAGVTLLVLGLTANSQARSSCDATKTPAPRSPRL
jgi:hypothetical protein